MYRKMLERNSLSPAEEARVIRMGSELEVMTKNAGWQHVLEFMEKNKAGAHSMMEKSTTNLSAWGFLSIFNAFAKYLMVLFEIRAYNKIKTYVDITIENGKRHASARAKREGRA